MKNSLTIVIAIAAAPTTAAWADNIDEAMIRNSREIIRKLKDAGYQNVGVLKFKVQKGDGPASFDVGRLNMNLATRLENVLVLANDPGNPIGIVRDASGVAVAKNRTSNYSTLGGRKGLFSHTYPLIWGNEKVKVDAFLTGTVRVSKDLSASTISISAFNAKSLDLEKIAEFKVRTDRYALADMNQGFLLSKRSLARKRGDDLDDDAVEDARRKYEEQTNDSDENPLTFAVFYDGEQQSIEDGVFAPGEFGVKSPQVGRRVHFELEATERLAIVLRVNGINTLRKEEEDLPPERLSKWILEPNTRYAIYGFYLEDLVTVEKFNVLSEADSEMFELMNPTKRGLIEIDLFRAGQADGGADYERPIAQTRSLTLRGRQKRRPDSLRDAQSAIRRNARTNKGLASRGIVIPGEAEKVDLSETSFKNPQHAGRVVIRYYR